jgi:replicative DNA helicase
MPHDLLAERGVLASVLLKPAALDAALEIVGPEDFFDPQLQRMFDAMRQLDHLGTSIDPTTVCARMAGPLEAPETYLPMVMELWNAEPTAQNVVHYARQVRTASLQRRLARRLADYSERALNGMGPDELLGELDMELTELVGDAHARMGVRASAKDLDEVIGQAERGELSGWSTGFRQFDDICGGFYPGDLIIVAGATSIGKSILALNVAEHFAFCGRRAVYFSIEMALAQLVRRVLSSRSDISLADVRKAGLSEEWRERLVETAKTLGPVLDDNLELWDVQRFTPGKFRIMAKAAKSRGKLALAVVDFIQLMAVDEPLGNKELEMAAIAQTLKATARELDIAVIAVSQLNLQWTAQQRRPTKEDLKYSSAIEQAADTVVLLHVEKGEAGSSREWVKQAQNDRLILLVDKQRNDATTWFNLQHRAGRFRFEEY